MRWRVINTDTEGPTGIAPVCDEAAHIQAAATSGVEPKHMQDYVFDCCPYPQLELWREDVAKELAVRFTGLEATVAGA